MKKLTIKQKMQHLRRARKRKHGIRRSYGRPKNRHIIKVDMWYRGSTWRAKLPSHAVVRNFPRLMCFKRDPESTLSAFEYVRRSLHNNPQHKLWFKPDLSPGRDVKVNSYIAMHKVEEISTSAALVLAAEYERKSMHMDEAPPLFDIVNWDPKLTHKLDQIGFLHRFEYHTPNNGSASKHSDVLTVPFYSGTQSEMKKVDEKLLKLVEHIDPDFKIADNMLIALNSAVGEAATNTREHAYKDYHEFKYPHVGRWWATGAASVSEREIVISLYDQGVSIPVSYPKLPIFKKIGSLLDLFDISRNSIYANDAKLIQAAAKYGKSGRGLVTDAKDQDKIGGYGLPQIKDAIDLCKGGSLMILSRGGRYIYKVEDGSQSEQLDTFECSVGGTLIEWTVTLPEPM